MKEKIKEICSKIKCCPLSDNKIDYVEEELLNELSYGWTLDVEASIHHMENLVELNGKLGDLLRPNLPKTVVNDMNRWDNTYDTICDSIIGRAKRWYDKSCKFYKAWNRTPLSFEEFAKISVDDRDPDNPLTEEEIDTLKQEWMERAMYGVKAKVVYNPDNPHVETITGVDMNVSYGLFHIYYETKREDEGMTGDFTTDEDDYTFPETAIPYLIPLELTAQKIMFKGKEAVLLAEYLKTRKVRIGEINTWPGSDFIRVWNPQGTNLDDFNIKIFQTSPEARKFAIRNHIDVNGLIPMGLAFDAVKEKIYEQQ